ncbi:cytochrome c biogenesis protein [Streptoalloteichus tenebrarius]|uniref:Cytochrome c biogenesis protein n=1 Tax=Streptoalloteichus tenebrarius (strain ATCC 17920 / DSM 40477 / JCM 4838 / CBS 697.72 / NBRC 16177 / NCIMB 11028 / NRRL B-12390 / A12253. 1 / ISP 5477) TaxID=1933 RepID=A0ABT1I1S8_STRSD|nr:cytochrome c biogenesis protein ResB [Streptoalloteichus tenebrarius]MCP2261737.1 cytochrome c biogenesis protein [Streptoalloteichus tenebrarius]BFF02451.1 cytochrome c biogenesis protein ResB [Streptoalloteichus tenebrarius]
MAGVLAFLRNTWRGLTAMRTALVLLFLLALAALPGVLLPQYSLNSAKVAEYKAQHDVVGPWLDKLGFFNVFAAPWFAAVYLMLFVSLIGCIAPRTVEFAQQLRAEPSLTPRRLTRMPHHARAEVDADPDSVIAHARQRLRGWRVAVREEADGVRTLSAERGFLREAGNLVFHFSMMLLLVGLAVGKLYGYEGQVIVRADGTENRQWCNSGLFAYDSFRPGLRVDGTELAPFCVRVENFQAKYLHTGQADSFHADISYQDGSAATGGGSDEWQKYGLEVNSPLRVNGNRVYLLGHGYAPRFVVTFPDGQQRTGSVQWKPMDNATLLSEGATKFDRPGVTDPEQRRKTQLAITGLFAPTAGYDGTVLTSVFPMPNRPAVAVDVYLGDLGADSGTPQSIFSIDRSMVDAGRLVKVARKNLELGQELTLEDGTRIRFDGVENWVSLQVSHDPAQEWVLVAAVLVLVGLGGSLLIKRRRLWVRASPSGGADGTGRTVVEVGGLARTDQAGYGEEFTRLADGLLAVGRPRAAVGGGPERRDVP